MCSNLEIFSLVCMLTAVAANGQVQKTIRQMSLGEKSYFIEMGPSNVACKVPKLAQLGYISEIAQHFSGAINGDQVQFYRFDCAIVDKNTSSLSAAERQVVHEIRARFTSYINTQAQAEQANALVLQCRDDKQQQQQQNDTCQPITQQPMVTNGSLVVVSERQFSVAGTNLAGEYARIIVDYDTVTYVHPSGRLQMTPIKCLSSSERALIDSLAAKARTMTTTRVNHHHQANKRELLAVTQQATTTTRLPEGA